MYASIRPNRTVLVFIGHILFNGSGQCCLEHLAVVRMYRLVELLFSSIEFSRVDSQKMTDLIVKIAFIFDEINVPHTHLGRSYSKIKPGLVVPQYLFHLLAFGDVAN